MCRPAVLLVASLLTLPAPLRADAVAPAPAPETLPAAAPKPTPFSVHLKDGTVVPCIEAPLVAMGRVLYRTADGARHALPLDQVDLDKTRPATAPRPPRPDGPPAARPNVAVAPGAAPQPSGVSREQRRAAPDFAATRADGTQVKLSELRGKVVLVDFWATWCGPCVMEMPNVKQVYKTHAGKDFEIVGVSLDHSRADLEAFMKAQAITWPQAFDGKGWGNGVARQYGVSSIPTMLLLDREGRVARSGMRGPMLGPAVAELIAEAPAKKGSGTKG